MRAVLAIVALLAIAASAATERTCYASGDPHIKAIDGTYFNNYETGTFRLYKLDGNVVNMKDGPTRQWGQQTTIQAVEVRLRDGRRIKAELGLNPCKLRIVEGARHTSSNGRLGFQVTGHNGFAVKTDAACSGTHSGYIDVYVNDRSTRKGQGFCFRTGHQIPAPPRNCRFPGGLRKAKRACRPVRCHRGIFASCVDDTCASGHAGNLANHLKRLSKERKGKPCKKWKLDRFTGPRKQCFNACNTFHTSCSRAAECARQLTNKSYMKVCNRRRRKCRKACKKNWRQARRCIIKCFRAQRGCRQTARCAASIIKLGYVCKKRGNDCAAKCFSRIIRN